MEGGTRGGSHCTHSCQRARETERHRRRSNKSLETEQREISKARTEIHKLEAQEATELTDKQKLAEAGAGGRQTQEQAAPGLGLEGVPWACRGDLGSGDVALRSWAGVGGRPLDLQEQPRASRRGTQDLAASRAQAIATKESESASAPTGGRPSLCSLSPGLSHPASCPAQVLLLPKASLPWTPGHLPQWPPRVWVPWWWQDGASGLAVLVTAVSLQISGPCISQR